MNRFSLEGGGSPDLRRSRLRMALSGLFMLLTIVQSCSFDLALDCDQFGGNCPILATLKKQISEANRSIKVLESKIKAFQNIPFATSCGGIRRRGVFAIRPEGAPAPVDTYCMGEWTVIAQRMDGSVNFYRNWQDYKHGFGNVSGEYWLGNDNIHYLTTQGRYRLRIDITDWNDRVSFAMYDTFYIDGEYEFYRLHIGNHTGPLSDSLFRNNQGKYSHNGQSFTTYDMDHDNANSNCARIYSGAYWYNSCYSSNLNGRYCTESEADAHCMAWWARGGRLTLKGVTWRIKELADLN